VDVNPMPTKGLFQLRSPADLLAKLRHDLDRLRRDPDDPYTAFDLFVTAEHMLDWLYPGKAGRDYRSAERNGQVILQVVSHLATGAKHMVPEDPRHTSVQHADVVHTAYGEGPYGARPYGGSSLVIELNGTAATEFGITITPLALAEKVVSYWEGHAAFQ
jgi:hypothetical protein